MQLLTTHTCCFQKFLYTSRWCLDLSVLQQMPGATLGLLSLTKLNGPSNPTISRGPQPPPCSGHRLCLSCCFCFFPTIQDDLLQQTPSPSGYRPGFQGSLTSDPGSGFQELPIKVAGAAVPRLNGSLPIWCAPQRLHQACVRLLGVLSTGRCLPQTICPERGETTVSL